MTKVFRLLSLWKMLIILQLIVVQNDVAIQRAEEQVNHVLMLKSFLEVVSELYMALEPATCDLLVTARALCRPELTNRSLDKIRNTIEPDVAYMRSALDLWNQRTFAVKTGLNGMLDVARQTYKEQTDEVHKHLDHLNGMVKGPFQHKRLANNPRHPRIARDSQV